MVLGWDVDTCQLAVHLTKRRHQHLLDILNDIPRTLKRISVNTWHKALLAELKSRRGLCSASQVCFKSAKKRIRSTMMVHNFLDDFWWIAKTDTVVPHESICEVVPTSPVMVVH